jgi:hypothetical protein
VNVRRKPVVVALSVLAVMAVMVVLVFAAAMYGQAREAAMTSCGGVPSKSRKGSTNFTVESRFLPWEFNCVFHDRAGHVVAKAHAPYKPPWPWR